jgi:predicted 2-oxoglutarate/Fe(II)-dependent dioxygenase YbiX
MTHLAVGDHAPTFTCASSINPEFAFDTVAGRRNVLCFIGDLGSSEGIGLIEATVRLRDRLHAHFSRVIFVAADPGDREKELCERLGQGKLVAFWDRDRYVARLYGVEVWRGSLLFDENLRFIATVPLVSAVDHIDGILAVMERLPTPAPPRTIQRQAPVLIVPNVFDPEFCRALIDRFEADGGQPSGHMNEKEGRTFVVLDPRVKTRRDVTIRDEAVRSEIIDIIGRRLRPEVRKAFASNFTRIERFIVARYDAEAGGHFSAHRDNTTTGTAHRKFAVTINLNAEAYEGGDLRFPEYGLDTYRAPTGGAVVFACGLMHEAMPVTSGLRYAFLPFLYDETGWRLRQVTRKQLG